MRAYLLVVLLGLAGTGSAAAQPSGNAKAQQVQIHEQKAREFLSQKKPELAAKEYRRDL